MTSYSVELLPDVELDLKDAYAYFEQCRNGLGSDFILCVEDSLSKVQRNPEQYVVVHNEIRRVLIKRFPYGVFYKIHGT